MAKGYGTSHIRRKMIRITDEVEHNIWWQVKSGSSSFWTVIGALFYVENDEAEEEEYEVKDFVLNGEWDI